jgi:hypothetical protein
MREVPFSIPVSGVVRIDGDSIIVVVNRAETNISLSLDEGQDKRLFLEPGRTIYDVILETARDVVRRKGLNRFSTPELFYEALGKYPQLKRNSFMSRVVGCTPNHSSYKHYKSNRDYFSHIGPGLYQLNDRYIADTTSEGEQTIFSQ